MDDSDLEIGLDSSLFLTTPSRVSFAARARWNSLSARAEPALPPARKRLAWVSLQGRLVGAEEATSARAVGGGLTWEAAAAWELFSPMQRVLAVAVMAAAEKESRKGRVIAKLQRSVEIRDEVLQNMQKKLEDLGEQMNSSKDQMILNHGRKSSIDNDVFRDHGMSERKEADFCGCGHLLLQLNPESGIRPLSGNLSNWPKDAGTECGKFENFKTSRLSMGEPEERRMSDLSDFSSVTSSVDTQLRTLAEEQDHYNLRKECKEKDAIINELTAAAHASSIADSKRISELEEIIRRKNVIITKQKKDMVVLEQKVIQLTRERRPSTASNMKSKTIPALATNIVYDMSSSSSSSSDSDTPVQQHERPPQVSVKNQSQLLVKSLGYSNLPDNKPQNHRSVSPVKARHIVSRVDSTGALRPKCLVSTSADSNGTRRRTQQESRPSTASNMKSKTIPALATNIVYDMSSSSSSSSDSDTPVQQRERPPQVSVKNQSQPLVKSLGYSNLPDNKLQKHRSVSLVKARHIVSRVDSTGALRPKCLVSTSADSNGTRRRTQQESSYSAPQKRWV